MSGRWELEACFAIPLFPICRHSFCHAIKDRVLSHARWRGGGNVVFIYVSALLFCLRFMGQIGTTVGQGLSRILDRK